MFNANLPRIFWVVACLLACRGLWAQQAPAPTTIPAEERFRVSLLTIGPGSAIHERFGHNTLVVEDRKEGQVISFNYGVFSFDDPGFISRFLEGKMMYWMDPHEFAKEVEYYRRANRVMLMQELNLPPRQKYNLVAFLFKSANAKLENRKYLYNYYTANCSTKVRDAIDQAIDGELRRQLESRPTSATYREHTRRASQYNFFFYTGLNFGLGPNADGRLNQWEDSFMPERLAQHIREVKLSDGRSLMLCERYLSDARNPSERPAADWTWLYLMIAAIWGGLMLWGVKTRRRWVVLISVWLWLVLSAVGGVFLAWTFMTNHWAAYWNQNVLLLPTTSLVMAAWWPVAIMQWNRWKWVAIALFLVGGVMALVGLLLPFGLAILLAGVMLLVPRQWAARGMASLLILTLALTVVAIGIKCIPSMLQMNREILALAGPLNAAMLWAGWRSLARAKEETHGSVQ